MSQQGAFGPRGPTGPTGISGRRGLQGDGFGPAGVAFYSGGFVNYSYVATTTNPSLTVSADTNGKYYSLEDNTSGTGTCYVTLPATYPVQGTFWVFYNRHASNKIQLQLTNGTAVYNGSSAATMVEIAAGNGCVLAYSGSSGSYIVF
jgi:hypothetical protein